MTLDVGMGSGHQEVVSSCNLRGPLEILEVDDTACDSVTSVILTANLVGRRKHF